MILFWLLPLLVMVISTINAVYKLRRKCPGFYEGKNITIIKPLKDDHDGLKESLESFFNLDYPKDQFKLHFCTQFPDSEARELVRSIRHNYPNVTCYSTADDPGTYGCANPKIKNMYYAYENAKDLILVSDSSAKVHPSYLRKMMSHLKDDVGVVTGIVSGAGQTSFGGEVEAVYLNSFFARARILADTVGYPTVMGMSMLFRKSDANKFGGFNVLANYLAEDYMLGEKMQELGLKIVTMMEPVKQNLGNYSVKSFLIRHVRWGRLRKAHFPIAFCFEPFTMPIVFGTIGSISLMKYGFDPLYFFVANLAFAFVCDFVVLSEVEGKIPKRILLPLAWGFREVIALPLWAYTLCGNKINWKGTCLRLRRGGRIEKL